VFRRQLETVIENCWTRLEKSTYFFIAVQGRATDVLHGISKCTIYEETFQALNDRFRDKYFAAAYRREQKERTDNLESPCKTATTIEQIAQRTYPNLPETTLRRKMGECSSTGYKIRT
jgi:hypothetical protein